MPDRTHASVAPPPPCGRAARDSFRRLVPRLVLTVLVVSAAASACSTVSGVQGAASGAGLHARYTAPLPEVEQAVVRALAANQLGVQAVTLEGDTAWVAVASRGMTFWSYGEIVRIRAAILDSATTDVWIYTQRRLATNVSAKGDWAEILRADIRDELKASLVSVPSDWIVLRDGPIRVLDISIPPGDTTPFHTHDAAVVYVPITVSRTDAQVSGGAWGATGPESSSKLQAGTASSDLLYANHPLTHRVTNLGPGEFRVLEIVNSSSGFADGFGAPIPGDLQMNSSWFHQSTVVLAAGKHTKWFSAEMPVVLAVPGSGQVTVERAAPDIAYDAPPSVTIEPGSWAFIPVGARYRLQNDGAGLSTVIVVQVRQKSSAASGSL